MKLRLFTLLFLIIFFLFKVKAQESLENKLLQLNLNALINKPIDSLLTKLPFPADTTLYIGAGSSIFFGASLSVSYLNNQYTVYIIPRDIQYITLSNPNRLPNYQAWPLHLLRKEKLGSVTIYKDADILKEAVFNENPLE